MFSLGIQTLIVVPIQPLILYSLEVVQENLIVIPSFPTYNSTRIMHYWLSQLVLLKKTLIHSNFPLWKIVKKNLDSLKKSCMLSKSINTDDLVNSFKLEEATKSLASRINYAWKINSKRIKITKQFKSWWNKECNNTLNTFWSSRSWENWKSFKHKVKAMK